ncbi:fatty acid desaturase [Macrococcus hajekii]|uniref:Fatty acid desaturase n=1 Tax=Macrococcus hajekii TaxID=198482 RepID=A0A4R6BK04_9STAP|nr:fatty acid desaturase [Macrococcus hajekii]TDM01891.1 fatty acid desaturase [Macrococcus hajekii]GGB08328.1 fatty acid desaturase [Macrococcus hajekii]
MEREKKLQLRKSVKPYERTSLQISIIQILNTLVLYIALIALGFILYSVSPWLSILCGGIGAFFLVRSFIIFHDCTHGSFFKSKKANKILGNITGVMTLFPYEKWRREHITHHATSGNLDKKGTGDIWMMTIEEYEEATPMTRLGYRLYRHPFVMFVLGPIYLLFITNRMNDKNAKPAEKRNTYLHNLAILVIYGLLIYLLGPARFFSVMGPVLFIGGMLGIWMFYIQHTFEDSYFEDEKEWDYVKAAVEGSSYYRLPKLFQWLTGNIGFHHVHHLSPRIPNYLLEQAHNEVTPLQHATTIDIRKSFESLKYKLYDPERKRFITFGEYKKYAK